MSVAIEKPVSFPKRYNVGLKLLKYDNIVSGNYKTNSDIDLPARCSFEAEVEKYCYMWREGGQFAKKIS